MPRNSFAIHGIEKGHDIQTLQELLSHVGVEPTMIDTQVLNQGDRTVKS